MKKQEVLSCDPKFLGDTISVLAILLVYVMPMVESINTYGWAQNFIPSTYTFFFACACTEGIKEESIA